jgi:hypothetical protein
MTDPLSYSIYKDGEEHKIIIKPVKEGDNLHSTGVFKLSEGKVSIGDIIFDDKMQQWEYTGLGDLTHQEASEIAGFIKVSSMA